MTKAPKVMVGMPTRGFPWVRSILYAQQLATELGTGLAIQVGQPVALVRNRLVRTFLASDCTHFLMMDDDVEPPQGALARLLAMDRPVATGVYPLFSSGRLVASVKGIRDKDWPETCPPGVFPVKHSGLGFALVQRQTFERIGFPWFKWPEEEDGTNVGEDVWFCHRVREAGLQIVCDGSVACGHVKCNFDLAHAWSNTPMPEALAR
jgi:GT2 family glycosyltransferase